MNSAGFWILLATAALTPVQANIVVAFESGVDAYTEALEGIRAGAGPSPLTLVDLHAASGAEELTRAISARDTRIVIAVGSRALKEVQIRKPAAPVIAAMVLHGPESESAAGHVDLDIALGTQLAAMKALLPRANKVGIIHNPQRSRYSIESLEARAQRGLHAPGRGVRRPGPPAESHGFAQRKSGFRIVLP
jgi:hypothetical protein